MLRCYPNPSGVFQVAGPRDMADCERIATDLTAEIFESGANSGELGTTSVRSVGRDCHRVSTWWSWR